MPTFFFLPPKKDKSGGFNSRRTSLACNSLQECPIFLGFGWTESPAESIITVVSKLITDRHFLCGVGGGNIVVSKIETDLWEFQQKVSHHKDRFSLESQIISITDTDTRLKTMSSVIISAAAVSDNLILGRPVSGESNRPLARYV